MFLFKNLSVWFAFLETESMWGVQERLSEIVTPRYLAERTDSKTVLWSMYLVWMGHLALVICRTCHLDGLKLMSHRFSHISRVWRSFCRVIDSPSELIARYMAVSSAKSLTLNWTGQVGHLYMLGRVWVQGLSPAGHQKILLPCLIWLHLEQQFENENPRSL